MRRAVRGRAHADRDARADLRRHGGWSARPATGDPAARLPAEPPRVGPACPRSTRPACGPSRSTSAATRRARGPPGSTPTGRPSAWPTRPPFSTSSPAAAHVVGHDFGALVGWQLAAAHPERVRSLTAVSVPHPGRSAGPAHRPRSGPRSPTWRCSGRRSGRARAAARDGAALRTCCGRSASGPPVRRRDARAGPADRALNWYRALSPGQLPVSAWSRCPPRTSGGTTTRWSAGPPLCVPPTGSVPTTGWWR